MQVSMAVCNLLNFGFYKTKRENRIMNTDVVC